MIDFKALFGRKTTSKSIARSRLHFVLVQDRTGLSNDDLANFKQEMVAVIEKYFVIDKQGFDIEYKRDTDLTTLVINSPIVVRRQEAIKHAVGAKGHLAAKVEKVENSDKIEVAEGAATEAKADDAGASAGEGI